ncbi:hypothetical protein EVAR_39575_1 [Eumeta japonica]|uniref:Uncharacterized protein n=1 Tax=Eumeta variegata TaxID=151549 RepID=A0A4C1XLN3_EUMVA|nr:hypothetical protein EVAR_39575_1 [Eumeta japonica]
MLLREMPQCALSAAPSVYCFSISKQGGSISPAAGQRLGAGAGAARGAVSARAPNAFFNFALLRILVYSSRRTCPDRKQRRFDCETVSQRCFSLKLIPGPPVAGLALQFCCETPTCLPAAGFCTAIGRMI